MSEENWHERYKAMLKDLNWNHKDVSEMIGTTWDSERTTMQPSKPFPRRAKLAVLVWEEMNERSLRSRWGSFTIMFKSKEPVVYMTEEDFKKHFPNGISLND